MAKWFDSRTTQNQTPTALAAVHSRDVVLLLFDHCLCSNCLWGFSVTYLLCLADLCVFSGFAIISQGKRDLVALLLLCSECNVALIVL